MSKPGWSFLNAITFRYALFGVLFGFLFPIVATLIQLSAEGLPFTLSSATSIHRTNTLIWIIDTAPLFLGVLAAIAGYRDARLHRANALLSAHEKEMQMVRAAIEHQVYERTGDLENANEIITRRASQLKTITELSEAIAQVQDLSETLPAATRLISERFGFYHVGIFLVDEPREYAVLQAANSEGGERMLKRGHRLQLGVGVVGFCAQTGQPRIALDVGTDAIYFNNPDLPETRSEVALPLRARGQTVGVLDVQSTEASAFTDEDLEVLTVLANQVSIALENARLLAESRAAYMQAQEVYNEFTRTEWSRIASRTQQPGFRYQTGRVEMLEGPVDRLEVRTAVQHGEVVIESPDETTDRRPAIAVPVRLRGEVVGVLHIESHDARREWQDDEVSLLRAVAERAAFAMENARLFQDARRRAAKERLISEATSRISNAFNVENILQTTAEELERVLGGSEISIHFHNKEKS